MEFTEQQVYEAMGMSAPEEPTQQPTGGNEPDTAKPAAEETHGTPEGGTDGGTVVVPVRTGGYLVRVRIPQLADRQTDLDSL